MKIISFIGILTLMNLVVYAQIEDEGDFAGPLINIKDISRSEKNINAEFINDILASAANHSVVYFPAGVYEINSSIRITRSHIELRGDSGETIFKVRGDGFIPLFIQAEKDNLSPFPPVLENITVRNITIDANGHGKRNAGVIMCNGVRNYLILNNEIFNSGHGVNGIAVSQPGSIGVIKGNKVYDCGKGGIYAATYSEKCLIEDNIVYNISNKMFPVPGIQIIGGENTTVKNNTVYNCSGSGIYCITGKRFEKNKQIDVPLNCSIYGNVLKYNKRYGVEFGNAFGIANIEASRTNGVVFTNEIFNNGLGGIMIKNRRSIILKRNVIYSNGTNGNGKGIHLVHADSIIVSSNLIYDNYLSGVYLNGVTNTIIDDNELTATKGEQLYGFTFGGSISTGLTILGNTVLKCKAPILKNVTLKEIIWKSNKFEN